MTTILPEGEGEYLFRDTLTLRLSQRADGWNLRYVLTDEAWRENGGHRAEQHGDDFIVPLSSKKGFAARLRLKVRRMDS